MSERQDAIRVRARALVRAQSQFMEDLVALRKRQGLTQQDVADRMDVTQSAVAQFERYDANPSLNTIGRYALAIGASINFSVTTAQRMQEATITSRPVPQMLKTEDPTLIKANWSNLQKAVS